MAKIKTHGTSISTPKLHVVAALSCLLPEEVITHHSFVSWVLHYFAKLFFQKNSLQNFLFEFSQTSLTCKQNLGERHLIFLKLNQSICMLKTLRRALFLMVLHKCEFVYICNLTLKQYKHFEFDFVINYSENVYLNTNCCRILIVYLYPFLQGSSINDVTQFISNDFELPSQKILDPWARDVIYEQTEVRMLKFWHLSNTAKHI